MKNIFIFLCLLLSGNWLLAQGRNYPAPPSMVRQSFQHDFPHSSNVRWSHNSGQWHADFKDDGPEDRGEMTAHYDEHGRHIESYIPYDMHDVPPPVTEQVHRRYNGAHEYGYARIERPGDRDFFEVRLRHQGKDRKVYLDEQGYEREYHHGGH